MTLDAHHHLWRYRPEEFGWLDEPMRALRRDFLIHDLRAEMSLAGVRGAVAVEARQTLDETRWLLEVAREEEAIRGVVGWAPLASKRFPEALEEFSAETKLKGLRHVIQDEPDENFILREDFNRGIAAMKETGLVYDILVFARQLPQTVRFVDKHPQQVFVLDHAGKPKVGGELEPWASQMRELARRENVWCKLSGLVTETDCNAWSMDGLRPYLDVLMESFGPERVMVGSDWPVCLVAAEYGEWFDSLRTHLAEYSAWERERIFGGNAVAAYRL